MATDNVHHRHDVARSRVPPRSLRLHPHRHAPYAHPPLLSLLRRSPVPGPEAELTGTEVRWLVRLVGVKALKRQLRADMRGEEAGYGELLDGCVEAGAARTGGEAKTLAWAMDDAVVMLLFRDKAYLHPEKRRGSGDSEETTDKKEQLERERICFAVRE